MKKLTAYALVLFMLSVSCSDWFEYSPYDTEVGKRHPNNAEISIVNDQISETDTLKFAVVSDVHDCYDDLLSAVKCINKQNNLRFVICCGDITNSGLIQQYEWYVDVINRSEFPFLSIIGNHDYRANGRDVYEKIFGNTNFSFVIGHYEFIILDNVIWENGNRTPHYDWLADELSDENYEHVVFSHIPPWCDQMGEDDTHTFCNTVTHKNTMLCIHGHTHVFDESEYNEIHTLVSEAINAREYYIINLIGKECIIQRHHY